MSARAGAATVDRALAEALGHAADGSAERALAGLLEILGRETGASYAGFWTHGPGGPVERAAWPAGGRPRSGTDRVAEAPGPGGDRCGWVVLATSPGRPLPPAGVLLLERVARYAGLVAGAAALAAELRREEAVHRQLAVALRAAPETLRATRAAEQRRGVVEVLSAIVPSLAELRRRVRACAAALPSDPAAARSAGVALAGALETLLDRFRVVVRGVHSTVLREHGLPAALVEFAEGLDRPVRLVGDPPRGLDPDVASALYPAAVAVLRALSAAATGGLLLSVTAGAEVTVEVTATVGAPTRVMAVVAAETAQLEAVGGRLGGTVDGGVLRVAVSVPDRLRPPARPGPPAVAPARTDLLTRVRALCAAAGAAYGTGPGAAELAAVAARLEEPVRLAVAGAPPLAGAVAALLTARTGPVVRVGGAGDPVDAVLHLLPDVPGARPPADPGGPYPLGVVVRGGPGRDPAERRGGVPRGIVELGLGPDGVPAAGLAALLALVDAHVRQRSDPLRCRSAIRGVRAVLERHPVPPARSAPVRHGLEALEAGAAELAELALLADLRIGATVLPAGSTAEVERLLGAAGPSAPARLGLHPGAKPAEIRVAATEAGGRWTARAEHRIGGRAGAEVCRAAVRACERILAVTPG